MNITNLIFYPVPYLVHVYTLLYLQKDIKENFSPFPNDFNLPVVKTFDFIVVGGGSAGCVVANLLSQKFTVLLLEVGGDPPPQSYVPAFVDPSHNFKDIAFQYQSVSVKNFSTQTQRVVNCYVGKVLGGTGVLNGLAFSRGSPFDFDNWANVTGDISWNYQNVLPFFKKSENYMGQYPSEQHGYDGPLVISRQKYAPGLNILQDAGKELGYQVNNDPNGPQMIGINPIELNTRFGRRFSTYDAFLKPALKRKNLKVLRYAMVYNVLLDENNRAYGVNYTRHGIPAIALASKEIILSAGTYGSPQILLRSGIGPTKQLLQAKITPKVDLPVGKNLQDHLITILHIDLNGKNKTCAFVYTETDVKDFLQRGYGPLTCNKKFSTCASGEAFFVSSTTVKDGFQDWADIHSMIYTPDLSRVLEKPASESSLYATTTATQNCSGTQAQIHVAIYLSRPKSRGNVKLNTSNIVESPLIDLNIFSARQDIQTVIDGIKKTLKIFEGTKAYREIGASYSSIPQAGCENYRFRSDAYWECYIRQTIVSGNHPAGTCKMAQCGVNDAVVDSNLRVCDVEGLRIIDASIFPYIPNANIQAPIIMVAQKGSANILNSWKCMGCTKCSKLRRR